jgi:flagellar basal body-associated protein FliL
MRRLTTKQEQAKKKKRNSLIIGIVLVFVMLFSVLGYSFMGQEPEEDAKKVIYNGFEFINLYENWILTIGNLQFGFKYNPKEVEKINSEVNSLESYSQKPLYINSENQEAEYEIYKNLNQIALRSQNACFDEQNCEEGLPLKNCTDNFIIIREAPISNIAQEENCVFISGPKENLTRITDEFLFKIIGIE